MRHKFESSWSIPTSIPPGVEDFRYDPMFFHADWEYFSTQCPAFTETRRLGEALFKETNYQGVIDTRVHMLKPGWYPAIPGWHCDEVFRPGGQDSQPDLKTGRRGMMSTGYLGLCPTEFASGTFELDIPEDGRPLWGRVNEAFEKDGSVAAVQILPGEIVVFDSGDLHTATECTGSGWRLWGRVIAGIQEMPVVNEIRRQVQAYVSPSVGW